jgi:hypothetical protein
MVCSEVLGGDERTRVSEGIIRIDSGDCDFCFALCRVCLFVRTSSISFHPHPPHPTVLETSGWLCSRDNFLSSAVERFNSFYSVRIAAYRQLLHLHRTWFCLHEFDAIFTTTSPAAAWYLPLIIFIGTSGCYSHFSLLLTPNVSALQHGTPSHEPICALRRGQRELAAQHQSRL